MLDLSLACGVYDRTRALHEGRVTVEGCRLTFPSFPIEEMFTRAFRDLAFDVTELSLSNYMRQVAAGTNHYSALPIFTSRSFRHSAFYIRTDRGIERPEDLKGKLLGVREYTNTAALVARGILSDEYGVRAQDVRWLVGDVDEVERDSIPVPELPAGFAVTAAAPGQLLNRMLAEGEIDGLLAYKAPDCFLAGHPNVRRLFPDWVAAEQAYYRKTGIFPIMHPVGARKALLDEHPWLAGALFAAFGKAKALAYKDMANQQALKTSLPWLVGEWERTVALMGANFWTYGLEANRAGLDNLTRYAVEQGMMARRLRPEELFHPSSHALAEA